LCRDAYRHMWLGFTQHAYCFNDALLPYTKKEGECIFIIRPLLEL